MPPILPTRAAGNLTASNGMVRVAYFAQDSRGGEIYIGVARYKELDKHLHRLQQGNPTELKLLGVIQARNAAALVRELHRTFSDARVRGAWFKPVPDLSSYIHSRAVTTRRS